MFSDIWEVRLINVGKRQSLRLSEPLIWGSSQKDTAAPRLILSEMHALLRHFRNDFFTHRCSRQVKAQTRTSVPSEPKFLNIGSCLRVWGFSWKLSSEVLGRASFCKLHWNGVGGVMNPLLLIICFMRRRLCFGNCLLSMYTPELTFPTGPVVSWIAITFGIPEPLCVSK